MRFLLNLFRIAIPGIVLMCLSSCLKDDLDKCPVPLLSYRLAFTYVPLSDNEGFDPSELETLTVYAFDTSGGFVESFTDDAPRLGETDYGLDISLMPGKYDFYAWGNVRGNYRFDCEIFDPLVTQADNVRLLFDGAVNDTVSTTLSPLFFSSRRDVTVEPVQTRATVSVNTLHIVKNNYRVDIYMKGIPPGGHYKAVVSDDNGNYQFDNSFASSATLHYISPFRREPANDYPYFSSVSMLRLDRGRSPLLKLYDGDDLLYEKSLIKLLLSVETENRKIDFSRMYDFRLYIEYDKDEDTGETILKIRVNDWDVVEKDVIVDLGKPNLP